ncbi:TPA: hypothetical protein ODL99_004434, partial [Escherichia coli]|nr:hypothetical protein [Escherichia coli]
FVMYKKGYVKKNNKYTGKTAVILHGLFRTAEATALSFHKNVSDFLDADVFYCGYKFSDKPLLNHEGIYDKFGHMKINPKNSTDFDNENEVTGDVLRNIYGEHLRDYCLHDIKSEDLLSEIPEIASEEILFGLNPSRFLSMFNNIEQAYNLILKYEEKNSFEYDTIIVARPDLAFYSELVLDELSDGTLLIPSGMGFHPHSGHRNYGLVEPLYYKNTRRGTCIPMGMRFNDQLMAFKRNDAKVLENLLSECSQYIAERVPLTPETILFYHFNVINKLVIKTTDMWIYEIFRIGYPEIHNIIDIPVLERYDPHHVVVIKKAKNNRIKYWLKGVRKNFHFYKNKVKYMLGNN